MKAIYDIAGILALFGFCALILYMLVRLFLWPPLNMILNAIDQAVTVREGAIR